MGIMYGIFDSGDLDAFFKIERSTVQREALPADKCQAVDKWYQDDWGDWIDESGEEASLKAGLQHFYKKTGVQPYLWIMGEEGKDYMSEGSVEELADKKYKEMFGNDEGHLLIIFREYPNESSNYIVTATPGFDAETQVMDGQAREILLDYIDYFYTDNDLNEGRFFQRAFSRAADRIMIKQLSTKQLATRRLCRSRPKPSRQRLLRLRSRLSSTSRSITMSLRRSTWPSSAPTAVRRAIR